MKLHELLAIAANQGTQAQKTRADLTATFEKKRHLFEKKIVQFTPNTEGAQASIDVQSDLQTTVIKELEWLGPHLVKMLDMDFQVAGTNTQAFADIELPDGTKIATGVPATFLLELQKRLAELLQLAQAIPTLDPAKGFVKDEGNGTGVYRARDVRKNRTSKKQTPLVLYPATEFHPAQTQLIIEDVVVGVIEEQEWSGLMTPAEKASILDRIEELTRAVRAARARANEAEVDRSMKIGDALLGYIFG